MSEPHRPVVRLALDSEPSDRRLLSFETLVEMEQEAKVEAMREEFRLSNRAIATDHERVSRRARVFQEQIAAVRLTPEKLVEWRNRHSYELVPGPAMRAGLYAERRLAPEADLFDERMNAVLQKYANVPYGSAGDLILPQFWQLLDVAAESVEQAAYPGTDDARKRYALALRRCARELRDEVSNPDHELEGRARWRAIMTLRLSLDDGTTTLWSSSHDLIDFVGRQPDGSSQAVELVSSSAWRVVWDYAVVSRLRRVRPDRFVDLPDLRRYRVNSDGHFINERGETIRWIWDGSGSGLLEADAVLNDEAKQMYDGAFADSGLRELLSAPDWAERYLKSQQHREFRRRTAVMETGVGAAACDALADLLEADIGTARRAPQIVVRELPWDRLSAADFERLIFNLVSNSQDYENPEWPTHTNAPDQGRDIAVWRILHDELAGTIRQRLVIACKHWQSNSVSVSEIATLLEQMPLWNSPPVDVLVIATSGRFTSDGVRRIETQNQSGNRPRIEMWASSHLERLVAQQPALFNEFFA